eukprot:CAMPEP_0197877398 /NCGR_PEP_ID=MMETSP1439-20131203/6096_1 /TAXON_ID=66791 /ORGANISM="Gonyaulax spinifera, Strain CCMP409" /LENGTH=301 /DNA_ID=CAMNT_0043496737 /DNA_START=89 /DNA_END=994 /DNA_ORIENTATION=-
MSAVAAKRPLAGASGGPATAKARIGKSPPPSVAKAPVAKAPVAKAPVAKAPVAKAPASESPKAAGAVHDGLKRVESWREFENSDPLYAAIGQMSQNKVMDSSNTLRTDLLEKYLDILMRQKAAKKPKDWVEIWAAMDIPVTHQAVVLEPILAYGLEHCPEVMGKILAELLKGHRVKTKALEDAVQGAFKGGFDKYATLREMLFLIFPKGPQSEWGWSRVGWSWQEWWKIVEHVYESVEKSNAFDELAALLNSIEATGGKALAQQSMIWNEQRLTKARTLLCKFGSVEDEKDLMACMDATLR